MWRLPGPLSVLQSVNRRTLWLKLLRGFRTLIRWVRALGWQASIDRAGNAIAASGDGPYVALTAHLDTVIPARSKDEIEVDADGRYRGPGVCDNGAGLAALLGFARAWKTGTNLPEFTLSPLLVANVGEEGEGNLLGHALSVQAIGPGKAHRRIRGGRWRQYRSHHLPRFGQPALRGCFQRAGRA